MSVFDFIRHSAGALAEAPEWSRKAFLARLSMTLPLIFRVPR